ncbi:aldehyde dehydrogenase domain-containing protein [Podospora australis]|uniref:Aldehyde dehydrogenase domain-containing protein n=1 Tax=Podospora australis TaxID=1536484 RepID=A0AAN6X3J3_9PEZI|nr:aldehyde dehydrogenase domain-containing protein [Podospora australis]
MPQIHETNTLIQDLWKCDSLEKANAFIRARNGGPIHLHNFIDGKFQGSPEAKRINSHEPKTGKILYTVPDSPETTVEEAIRAAKDIFPAWSKTSRAVRSKLLMTVAELLRQNRELFAVWESIDQGKMIERARVEVDRAISNFEYFATFILHEQTAARIIDGVALTYEHRSPAGVFALISPWNMPLYLLTWKIAPCLAFGCTAVAKPSEVTSMSAFLLASVFQDAEVPRGVINIVFGSGATTGAPLVSSPMINGVSFTGGTETGKAIRKATAHQIGKHLSLELGGKNPTLVFADSRTGSTASWQRAIKVAAMAAFENQGEICLCGSRVYVESAIYAEFVRDFTSYVREHYVLGKTLGAVASFEHYNKIQGYLRIAKEENAAFLLGNVADTVDGTQCKETGYWIEPTVLTGVPETSRLQSEEIFGPVVTITPFDSEEEAIRLANNSEYGLAVVLLTTDGARMRRVGEQLEAGLVWVNSWLTRELGTPFGGMKNSGTGREGGEYSRDVFTVIRTIHLPTI